MKNLKTFEDFRPRKVTEKEPIRMDMLKSSVKKEAEHYINLLKNENPHVEELLVDDIFFLWDRYVNDDREGIEHSLSGKHHVFFFDEKPGYNNFLEHLTLFLDEIKYSYELKGQKMQMFGFKKEESFTPKNVDRWHNRIVEVDDGNDIAENVDAVSMLRDAKEIKNIRIYDDDKDGGQRFCSADILTDVGLLKIDWQMGISNSLYNAMEGDGYEAVLKRLKRMAKIKA